MTETIDAARLTLMLNDLRLPAIKQDWPGFAGRADKESWPAARLLASLAEHEPFPKLVVVKRGGSGEMAGLKVADEVIAIDGSYAKSGAPFYYFARKLQGPKNSEVQLVVLRKGREVLIVKLNRTQRLH